MCTITRIGTTRHRAPGAWQLRANATMRLPVSRAATVVRVERGTVLVTRKGDLEDHVLERGDELLLPPGAGPAVAWAFTEATVSTHEARPSADPGPEAVPAAAGAAAELALVGAKVAHELKNPLTAVKALVQLGLRNPAEVASHERLAIVEREVTRMQEILRSYLAVTRPLQDVQATRVALGDLVGETLRLLSARASDARVRLIGRGDVTVEADPRRLKEALLNLVANGIEATPPGGEVAVDVRPSGDGAELVVRDTGRGIPPDALQRLGTPFFTTREDGTGLGVVLARTVIALHGGSLRYESELGKGTTVRATLPRRARAA